MLYVYNIRSNIITSTSTLLQYCPITNLSIKCRTPHSPLQCRLRSQWQPTRRQPPWQTLGSAQAPQTQTTLPCTGSPLRQCRLGEGRSQYKGLTYECGKGEKQLGVIAEWQHISYIRKHCTIPSALGCWHGFGREACICHHAAVVIVHCKRTYAYVLMLYICIHGMQNEGYDSMLHMHMQTEAHTVNRTRSHIKGYMSVCVWCMIIVFVLTCWLQVVHCRQRMQNRAV